MIGSHTLPKVIGRSRRILTNAGRPVYDTLLGDPMREGRLRLKGMADWAVVAASTGLVILLALLASLLLGELWRRADLVLLSDRAGFTFMPETFFPVALLALAIAWVLLMWGALGGSPLVQLGGAIAFLALNAAIGRSPSIDLDSVAPRFVAIGYYVAPATLFLAALLQWRFNRLFKKIKPVLLGAVAAGVFSLFAGQLADYSTQIREGLLLHFPQYMDSAVFGISGMLYPLVFVAGIAVVEFGYDVAHAAAGPAWKLPPRTARVGLFVLLVAALWFQFFRHAGDWIEAFSNRPSQLAGPTIAVLVFFFILRIGRRRRSDEAVTEEAKEKLIYGVSLILPITFLIPMMGFLLVEFITTQFRDLDMANAVNKAVFASRDWLLTWGDVVLWVGALALGVYLARQFRENLERSEIGLGLILVALWVLPFELLETFGISIPMSPALMGVMVTFGIAGYAAINLRTLDTRTTVELGAIVLFLWLLTSEGDFLAIVGATLGLPGSFVIVFGIMFTLLTGSSFATSSSRHFPREARTFLWVGYMVLTTTILNWSELGHGESFTGNASARAFFSLGIPIGVWMLMRRWFAPPVERGATQSS